MSVGVEGLIGRCLWCGIARSTDERVVRESSSGGLVTSLLIAMFREGLIRGALVVKNEGLEQRALLARTEDELLSSAGSKYLQTPLNASLSELIKENGRFAVVALPCHLKGLERLKRFRSEIEEKVAIKIGLFCSHAVSHSGMVFLLKVLGVEPKEVVELRYRKKALGTTGLYVRTRSGREVFLPSYKYWRRFFNLFFVPDGCLYCDDMTAELSDVSIGDAWGFEGVERGLSLFVARREVGIEALKLALSRGLIEMRDVSPEEVVRSQRYLWIKKRGFVSGRRKIMGSAYHAIQVVGSSMSKSQWSAPLLRAWVRLLVARPYSLARH